MAAAKCCAASASQMTGMATRDQAGHVSLANAIAHLNTVSAGVSVEPSDYSWGAPSLLQQQALYSQCLQLAFMCTLPQMQYAHLSACPSLQAGRPAMIPGFMPPFAGFLPPVVAPCPAPSPLPAPCSPAVPQGSGLQGKPSAARSDGALATKASKNLSPSKKSMGSKSKASKNTAVVNSAVPAPPAGVGKVDADIELEDICRLLGDDAFLEHLQDDVLSEGSNGSSSTSDGRVLSKNNSNGCLSGSVNNEGGLFAGNNFAAAFDLEMDDLPAAAAAASAPPASSQPPNKATSGDLNNLVASSAQPRSTRASRSAAREAATAAKDNAGAGSGSPTKITLRVAKGGVQKASGSKPSKAQVTAAAAQPPQQPAAPVAAPMAGMTAAAQAEDCQLTAADLSRLLGEDDNRIPDGWDLDLDFENPFSCSITAF
ncbi:hypothetical protein PLESTB_000604600 [Pleodorina starrii]|uniref:Uncharacterized protein n=1 Tax=Pleodorina starrii TaxID=330485 RepID=A0A9W6BIY9_9CHLO|nr:hypothetical protein PLESTB_000604600 [Pleodorina starrii]